MMWCPSCRTEYREGISRCADCGTDLVDALPSSASTREVLPPVTGPFSPEDDVVELMTTTAAEAEVTAAHLRSSGIPAVVFSVGAYAGYGNAFRNAQGARIMVRRADLGRAAPFVTEQDGEPLPPRPTWVRGTALFALVLLVVPIAALLPQLLPVIIIVGFGVALTSRVRRNAR